MDSSIIAVRVANGSYVPVLETSTHRRRKLVVTTIRDDQTSVQIDLYRGLDESMEDATYVGSLMVDSIEPAPKGEADVVLLLGVDDEGNLNATATDKKSGEYQSLSVSLESIDQGGGDLPDFELSDEELTLDELSMDDDELTLEEPSASPSLGDVTLEEDLSLDVDSAAGTDTLAAGAGDVVASDDVPATDTDVMADLDFGTEDALTGLEEFSEESISLDESLSDESLGEISVSDEPTASAEDFTSDELPDLNEGMVEADLGEEDFTFDEPDENIFEAEESPGAETAAVGSVPDSGGELSELSSEASGADETDGEHFPEFDSSESSDGLAGAYAADAQPLTPRRSNALVFVGYIILALAALGVLTYLVFRLLEGPPAPPLRAALPLLLLGRPHRRSRFHRGRSRQGL